MGQVWDALNKKKVAPSQPKKEPLHKPEMVEGSMQIGKPKRGRPAKADKMTNAEKCKAYRNRKREKNDG